LALKNGIKSDKLIEARMPLLKDVVEPPVLMKPQFGDVRKILYELIGGI